MITLKDFSDNRDKYSLPGSSKNIAVGLHKLASEVEYGLIAVNSLGLRETSEHGEFVTKTLIITFVEKNDNG